MNELERYIKVSFDIGDNANNIAYSVEEKNLNSEFEYIPLLAQGYVRCIFSLKYGFFKHDESATKVLRVLVREILSLSADNIVEIKSGFNLDSKFDVTSLLKNKSEKGGGNFHSFISSFERVQNEKELPASVSVNYEIKIDSKGSMVMYHTPARMTNIIQIQAYVLMLAYLLSRFGGFDSFLFFYNYMIEIENQISSNNYKSVFGMKNIIRNATSNFRKIVAGWENTRENDLLTVFCLPRL